MQNPKVEADRLRRLAKRRGLILSKSPRRDPGADDYGLFSLKDARTGERLHSRSTVSEYALTLDTVRQYLDAPRKTIPFTPGIQPRPKPEPRTVHVSQPEPRPEVKPHRQTTEPSRSPFAPLSGGSRTVEVWTETLPPLQIKLDSLKPRRDTSSSDE